MIDTASYHLKNLITYGPRQIQSQVQNCNRFDDKASNKAHVFGEWGREGLLDGKNHNTDKTDTFFGR